MTVRRFAWIAWGLCLVGVVWGCGKANPLDRRPISGRVTLNGVPLEEGSISFQPEQRGGVSSGALITQGSYSIPAAKGLPVGKYRVMISGSEPAAEQIPEGAMPGDTVSLPEELIPPEYNVQSNQFIEVKEAGPYEYNYDILTEKKE